MQWRPRAGVAFNLASIRRLQWFSQLWEEVCAKEDPIAILVRPPLRQKLWVRVAVREVTVLLAEGFMEKEATAARALMKKKPTSLPPRGISRKTGVWLQRELYGGLEGLI